MTFRTNEPHRVTQIDIVGWLFAAVVVVIVITAVVVIY
jgi:hypothetical protein